MYPQENFSLLRRDPRAVLEPEGEVSPKLSAKAPDTLQHKTFEHIQIQRPRAPSTCSGWLLDTICSLVSHIRFFFLLQCCQVPNTRQKEKRAAGSNFVDHLKTS